MPALGAEGREGPQSAPRLPSGENGKRRWAYNVPNVRRPAARRRPRGADSGKTKSRRAGGVTGGRATPRPSTVQGAETREPRGKADIRCCTPNIDRPRVGGGGQMMTEQLTARPNPSPRALWPVNSYGA